MGPELLAGLPNDACQCPHSGILLKGELRIPFTDGHVTTIRAGEAYSLPPCHRFEVVEDAEGIEFSRTRELRETYEVIERICRIILAVGIESAERTGIDRVAPK